MLFAGGICLAEGFVSLGLSAQMGQWMAALTSLHLFTLMMLICLAVTFMTETTSNTATAALLMPVLAAAALAAGIAPELLMVPAVMSASCAFMLPVCTAPNTIVFSSGLVSTARMAREGFLINLLRVVVISTVCYFVLA